MTACTPKSENWVTQGEITVFSALLFLVVLSLLMVQFRSAIFYMRRMSAERAAKISVDSFLAEYNRPLKDYYQILAVDGGFGQVQFQEEQLEKQLERTFLDNFKSTWSLNTKGVTIDEPLFTMLVDGGWDLFAREICMNREEAAAEASAELILKQWRGEKIEASEELKEKVEEAENIEVLESSSAEETNREEQPENKVEDPRNYLTEIWNQGILVAACPENFNISEKSCSMKDVSFPGAGNRFWEGIDFKDNKSIKNLFDDWEARLITEERTVPLLQDIGVSFYIMEVFKNGCLREAEVPKHERVLNYEVEYILAGNESDSENLKAVLWKLVALRCVMNLSYLLTSAEKGAQVEEVALVLSAALLIPQFTKVTAFLLKTAWAFAESLADCRTLLKGGRIPIVKNDASWYLSWEQMMRLNSSVLDKNECSKGLDYEGYLCIFLQLMNHEEKYRRMTNLMEKNIRILEGYENFCMTNCIYGVQISYYCKPGMGMNYRVDTALSY